MSEKIKLYKAVESFIEKDCKHQPNEPFIINYKHSENVLPVLSDNNNVIQCVMLSPKFKEISSKTPDDKEIQIKVTDSSFDLVLYESNNAPNIIKCLMVLIVKDFEKENEVDKNEKNLIDINTEYKLLEKLKKFIFNYIKENKKKFSGNNSGNASGSLLEKILLDEAINNIRFFNAKFNNINYDNIKDILEAIKSVSSKLEIKQKKNETETNKITPPNENNETDKGASEKKTPATNSKNVNKSINDVLDELNPDFKSNLIDTYLDEMPEELVDVMKKYKRINFTKDMYKQYLDAKNAENA